MTLEELSKLDQRGALDLLYAYTTDIKRLDKEIADFSKEEGLWSSRVELARSKGLGELAAGAMRMLDDVRAKKAAAVQSRSEFAADAARIKEALPGIKAKERSIDPDALAAELSVLTGEALEPGAAAVERDLSALEKPSAESALEELKRKMGLS
ncbi:MAG TPA: hypothetical protein VIO60_06335 [Rectinemataceae bacterium]